MKKRWWIFIIIIVLLILIFPTRKVANDGGTVEYSALLYKVINWNRIRILEENKTGTEIYWFPKNFHSLDYYDPPRPEAIAIYRENNFVVANIGTYQWSKEVDGITSYINACGVGALDMNYKETLQIEQGENVKIQGLISNPAKIKIYNYDEEKEIENQLKYDELTKEINVSELSNGNYIVELYVKNGENEVYYSFKLQIVEEIENNLSNEVENPSQTFYAEIKNINNTNLLVDGLEVNDINYRGEFSFKVSEKTKIEWRNTKIDFSELEKGDNISITFTGDIQESYPAKINDVVKIQLLDDEK